MLNKRDIINFLYVISFPIYGIGTYISAAFSPSVGFLLAVSPHLLIFLFYMVDLLLKHEFSIRANWVYIAMTVLQLTCAASLFVSVNKHMPGATQLLAITKSVMIIAPFHAFVAVLLYNEKQRESFGQLTFLSFSLLLLINLVGFYVLGLKNELHSIGGRLNFPFLDGFYSGACLLAILNLMLLFYIKKSWSDPLRVTYLIAYFLMNMVLMYLINSRLNLLIFLGVFTLFAFNIHRSFRGVFLASVFTIPILLNAGMLIYRVLSLPFFVFIMKRVNLADVTSFDGRAFLWQRAIDWLLEDQRGLIFGNGSNGQYFLHLIPDIAKLFGAREEHMHLHSTVLMTVIDQGLFGYLLLLLITYLVYQYYRNEFQKNNSDAIFFSIVVFIIFVMQVDTFVYMGSLGYVILAALAARIAVRAKTKAQE